MDAVARWLAKLIALFALLVGSDEFSKASRHQLLGQLKKETKHILELGKKLAP